MSANSGAVARAARAARGALPHGQLLTSEAWARRHRGIVVLLWLHVAGLAAFGVARGKGLAHSVSEAAVVAVFALLAAWPELGRRVRSAAAVLGLITSSAVLVHLSGGVIEMHFHFFVMVGVITLYQDWLPFGLALGYVVLHHGLLGVLEPTSVYNHPAAWRAPWTWALVHGGFVLAASVAYLVNWRLSETQAVEISRLVSRLEGLARTDALTGVPNRRVWEEELPRELDRARRMGTALCVAMIDLDHHERTTRAGRRLRVSPQQPRAFTKRAQDAGQVLAGRHRVGMVAAEVGLVDGQCPLEGGAGGGQVPQGESTVARLCKLVAVGGAEVGLVIQRSYPGPARLPWPIRAGWPPAYVAAARHSRSTGTRIRGRLAEVAQAVGIAGEQRVDPEDREDAPSSRTERILLQTS